MRESIGTSFLLNFIIVFIVFIMAFLAATLSYYKAYRINNMILHAIEKFEGYNDYSIAEIKTKLGNMGYQTDGIKCKNERFDNSDAKGVLVNKSEDGYCIYRYWNENPKSTSGGGKANTDIYYSFGVVSFMRMEIPLFGGMIKMPVYSRTYNIYYFTGSSKKESTY